eukprot:scaffold39558_cov56-Phaeocystis_antarctica.AAC.1
MANAQQGELPPHEMEEAGAALVGVLGGLRTIFAGVVPPAQAEVWSYAVEKAATKARVTELQAAGKVEYHPNVRCRRGDGCTCGKGGFNMFGESDPDWPHPVIVGPMYRVGEVCVCEGAASEEEKANDPVKPAWRDVLGPIGLYSHSVPVEH